MARFSQFIGIALGKEAKYFFLVTILICFTGNSISGSIDLVVLDTITPLLPIVIKMQIDYQNYAGVEKRPITKKLEALTGTPKITFKRTDSNIVTPGAQFTFTISVLLTKMRCPLQIEVSSANQKIYIYIYFIWLDVPHLTYKHSAQDCIAS